MYRKGRSTAVQVDVGCRQFLQPEPDRRAGKVEGRPTLDIRGHDSGPL